MISFTPQTSALSPLTRSKMAPTTPENVVTKPDTASKATNGNGRLLQEQVNGEKVHGETGAERAAKDLPKAEVRKEEAKVAVEVEPKTGVSFPVKLADGKQLLSVGMRKKSMLGISIKIYGFGMYANNEQLKDILKSKIGNAPAKPTKEVYQVVIDSDVEMTVRLGIVLSNLTMSMVRRSFDEGLGASIRKLTGGKKNEELANKVMGEASDDIKLTLQASRKCSSNKRFAVKGEVVSKLESELLCRAYIHMYLGDDAFDKDAKEKFGKSLLSLF